MTQEQKQPIQLTPNELLMSEGIEKRIDALTSEMMKEDSQVTPIDATSALVVAVSRALSHINDHSAAAMVSQLVIESAASHTVVRYIVETLHGQISSQDKLIRELQDKVSEYENSDEDIKKALCAGEEAQEIEEAEIKE
ncbi:hypothetical protein LZS85_15705 [Aliivibrio fischeri]|uniref:hypothetical protein n=1 Tax=Aliivibrio fischeri TaxID=668 RepID=UPI001F1ED4E0|nr:hypothetical protein [Aliivibrio fischeri]MCE7567569.1 hypothetical protein [Aliivibrio fischeri]